MSWQKANQISEMSLSSGHETRNLGLQALTQGQGYIPEPKSNKRWSRLFGQRSVSTGQQRPCQRADRVKEWSSALKEQINNKLDKQTTVPVDIFTVNGARLADKAAVEDYHANSIVSNVHRMSFKMRRPVRLYAMVRDGLSPDEGTEQAPIFARSELPPSFDLSTVRQLESVWYAAMTGVAREDNLERRANVWMRVGAVGGSVCHCPGRHRIPGRPRRMRLPTPSPCCLREGC